MPYAIRGNAVVKSDTGKVVGRSKNPSAYIRVLRAVDHGWRPTRKKRKSKGTNKYTHALSR